jgi:hypothetical protein
VTKNKIFLILFHYKFRKFDYYKNEIKYLKKIPKLKVIIHDLSSVVNRKPINRTWMNASHSSAIKFFSLSGWIFDFLKIINKNKNILIYNNIECVNFSSFIIYCILKINNIPMLVASSPQLAGPKIKKNYYYFISKLSNNFFKIRLLYFYTNFHIFSFLNKFIKFSKIISLKVGSKEPNVTIHGNIKYINFNSFDVSNHLLLNNKKNTIQKNYILYLDSPTPYFKGDRYLLGEYYKKNEIENWYNNLVTFFNNLENISNSKIIIIPHHKNKGFRNPYFNKFEINHKNDASIRLSVNCKFIISKGSTAISSAIINYKPLVLIYSSWYKNNKNYISSLFYLSKLLGLNPINIDKYRDKEIFNTLTVNKKKYDLYKYRYLTHKNIENIPNYKIIKNLIKNIL